MSHIPQPGQGEGEQIPSMAASPPMPDINLPQSQSNDITHGMQMLTFDQWNVTQFRFMSSFSWNTHETPGKVLWFTPISPLFLDTNLAYYSKLFNQWAGDFEFMFKVAGTGFHAGMLSFAKLPPNIHPNDVQNPNQLSVFPWSGVDPKCLEPITEDGQDIRQVLFHWMNPKTDAFNEVNQIGGYLCAFINLDLNTGVGAAQRISVGVWVRAKPNFQVRFVVPIALNEQIPSSIAPCSISENFNFTFQQVYYLASTPTVATLFVIEPASVKVLNTGVYNTFDLDGKGNSDHDNKSFTTPVPAMEQVNLKKLADNKFSFEKPTPQWPCSFKDGYVIPVVPGSSIYLGNVSVDDKWVYSGGGVDLDPIENPYNFYGTVDVAKSTKLPTDASWGPPIGGESLVVFADSTGTLKSAQTAKIAELFATTRLSSWLAPGTAARFLVFDNPNKIPLGYLKLYRKGFMTMVGQNDQVKLQLKNVRLEFDGFMEESGVLPSRPQDAFNLMVTTMYQRPAIAKAAKKTLLAELRRVRVGTLIRDGSSSVSSSGWREHNISRSDIRRIFRSSSNSAQHQSPSSRFPAEVYRRDNQPRRTSLHEEWFARLPVLAGNRPDAQHPLPSKRS